MTSTFVFERPASRLDVLRDEHFWRETFPDLSINTLLAQPISSNGPDIESVRRAHQRMDHDGYFHDEDPGLFTLAPQLGEAVKKCHSLGIPPPFIFLFDEPWLSFMRLHPMIASILGPDYQVLPDFWTWHVDHTAEEHGWKPHRDKTGGKALAADGTPLSLTIWIPLSEAKPLNGCMYMLPKCWDPVYGTPEDSQYKIDFPSIRALPAKPGEYLCWNQAVLHWGARSSRFADGPRMSMALEFQRGDIAPFNQPLIPPLANLDFPSRLKLVAKQILQYKHMYPLTPEMQEWAQATLKS